MRKLVALCVIVIACVLALMPSVCYTEDRDTVLLARTIYALGQNESYETKLALGTVVMNRVESDMFAGSMHLVLTEQQQFPFGARYDAESLRAAHALLAGTRALPSNALYYRRDAASATHADSISTSGSYSFYAQSDRL